MTAEPTPILCGQVWEARRGVPYQVIVRQLYSDGSAWIAPGAVTPDGAVVQLIGRQRGVRASTLRRSYRLVKEAQGR